MYNSLKEDYFKINTLAIVLMYSLQVWEKSVFVVLGTGTDISFKTDNKRDEKEINAKSEISLKDLQIDHIILKYDSQNWGNFVFILIDSSSTEIQSFENLRKSYLNI